MNNEINVDEILKRILEEEAFVKDQVNYYAEFMPEFISKALEDIELIEMNALELDKDHKNQEIINSLFRSYHNIKGSAGFVGQEVIQKIAHQTETLLDYCRKGSLEVTKNIVDCILTSADYIKRICDDSEIVNDESFINIIFSHIDKMNEIENSSPETPAQTDIQAEKPVNTHFLKEFKDEILLDVETINNNLLDVDFNSDLSTVFNSIFKACHTIKGIAGFSGQILIQRLAYQSEELINACMKEKCRFNERVVELVLSSCNYMKKICNSPDLKDKKDFIEGLYTHLQEMDSEENCECLVCEPDTSSDSVIDGEFWQDFVNETREHLESFEMNVLTLDKDKENKEIISNMFRTFHTIKGLAGFVNQELVQKIAHQTETLLDDFRKGILKIHKTHIDLILESADYIKKICEAVELNKDKAFNYSVKAHLDRLEASRYGEPESNVEIIFEKKEEPKKLGEILVEQKVIQPEQVQEVLEVQKEKYSELKFGQVAVKEQKVEAKDVLNALRTQQNKPGSVEEYMRIPTSKIDNLTDMIGELIITQSLVEREAISRFGSNSTFINNFLRMSRITKDIQNLSMFLKMVSLKSTFQKITRIARDTISELNKNVEFVTYGEETEIDRNITEKLLDPLVHLVKNAISHGIESAEERAVSGKSSTGTVKVSAYSKRGNVYIEVEDDGRGINPDKIYKKAIEKNLADPNKSYTEKEIIDFILLPGFSTAEVVNNISGRGVGMDVVRTEVVKIGGKLEINNRMGFGCTFILKLPINNAVINGSIVSIKGLNYIIPTVNVKQILQPKESDWVSVQGKNSMLRVREEIMPLINISRVFKIKEDDQTPNLVVILELDQKYRALPVENIIGRQEIVLKSLGEEFNNLSFVSGSTILGDGHVSLILDIENLFKLEGAY